MQVCKKFIFVSVLVLVCFGISLDSFCAVKKSSVNNETSGFTPIPIETPSVTPKPDETPISTPKPTETPYQTPSSTPTPRIQPTRTATSTPTALSLSAGIVSISGKTGKVNQMIEIPIKAHRIKNVRKFTVDVNEHFTRILAKVETLSETPSETPTQTPGETPTEIPIETPSATPTEIPSETPSETPAGNLLYFKGFDVEKTMIDKFKYVNVDVLPNNMGVRITAQSGMAKGISGSGTLVKLIYTAEKAGKTYLQIDNLDGDLAKSHAVNIAGMVKINPGDMPGDIDGDGAITSGDVLLLLKYLAKQVPLTPEQLKAADCNQDGKADLNDVQWIFNLSIGLSTPAGKINHVIPQIQPLTASSLSLADKAVKAGDTFTMDVSVGNASNINAFSFDLTYDANKLEFVSVQTTGTMTDNFAVFGNEVSAGKATILGIQGMAPSSANGSGIFIKAVLRAKASATGAALAGLENLGDGLKDAIGKGATVTIQPATVQPTPASTPTPSVSQDFTVSLDSKTISAGQTAAVNVIISGNSSPINSYTLDFVFDPALLSYIGYIKTGTLSENASIGANLSEKGKVTISGIMPSSNSAAANGILLQLQIKALPTASGSATISLENLQADIQSAIPEDSIIDILSGLPGDTDGNGVIDIRDIYYFSTSWLMTNTTNTGYSDINNDVVIDQYDLLQLMEFWQ